MGVELNQDVIDLIAERVSNNVRELEGILTKLMAYSIYMKQDLNVATVNMILGDTPKPVAQKSDAAVNSVSLSVIRKKVCDFFNIEESALQNKTRVHDVVEARQLAMYLAKQHTKAPLTAIGAAIGGRNHATVLHSCKSVSNLMDTDKAFKAQIEELEKIIAKG